MVIHGIPRYRATKPGLSLFSFHDDRPSVSEPVMVISIHTHTIESEGDLNAVIDESGAIAINCTLITDSAAETTTMMPLNTTDQPVTALSTQSESQQTTVILSNTTSSPARRSTPDVAATAIITAFSTLAIAITPSSVFSTASSVTSLIPVASSLQPAGSYAERVKLTLPVGGLMLMTLFHTQ